MAERGSIVLSGHRFISEGGWHPHERHHSQGQWSQKVTSDWQSDSLPKPFGFGSLAAAVEHHSPPKVCGNGHLPHEIPQAENPRLNEPRQPLWHRIPVAGLDVIEIWSRQNDKS